MITRSILLLLLFLSPRPALTVHQNPVYSVVNKAYESSGKQKKKAKEQPKKLTKRQKIGLYLLLPLFLVSFLLVVGIGVSGSDLILFAFLSLACLLAFIFSIIKGEDTTIKVGNVLLVIATSINLLAYWWHRKIGGG
jgi:NADH:ubiquinone oxidoreductase subunit 3 (subunit A)